MNILLIGNGFDLAHGLPTKYVDFCKRVRSIYTLSDTTSVREYIEKNINNWEINDLIKQKLINIFENRKCKRKLCDGMTVIEVTTLCKELDELYNNISCNIWLEHFWHCTSYIGENWIDFESEISRVIQALDVARNLSDNGNFITNLPKEKSAILLGLCKNSKGTLQKTLGSLKAIDSFTHQLDIDLQRLIRALEIYLCEFISNIECKNISPDIQKIYVTQNMKDGKLTSVTPAKIISFNYTNTFQRIYDKNNCFEYDFIHGKADIKSRIDTNNMVLGIDEYLTRDRKNQSVEFTAFKKYYQIIYKGLGSVYRDWVDEIKQKDKEYRKEVKNIEKVLAGYPLSDNERGRQKSRLAELKMKPPKHNLYIFGHSLDVTDKDILRKLILNDSVHTIIFYQKSYDNNGNDDNGRKSLREKIDNLVKVIGQGELIRRTGGNTKTIEFRLQRDMVEDMANSKNNNGSCY